MEMSGNHAGKGNQAMFNAKDTTILMTAATVTLAVSIGIIAAGDGLVGGFMMLVGAYTAIVATLPGDHDNA